MASANDNGERAAPGTAQPGKGRVSRRQKQGAPGVSQEGQWPCYRASNRLTKADVINPGCLPWREDKGQWPNGFCFQSKLKARYVEVWDPSTVYLSGSEF